MNLASNMVADAAVGPVISSHDTDCEIGMIQLLTW